MRSCAHTVFVWCIEYSIRDMFRWWIFVVHTAGGRQIQEHLPLSSILRAELTDGVLTLWNEQGGKRYNKTSCQGQAQGSWLKRDENIKIVTLSYKANTSGSIFSVEQVQEHAAAISVCLLHACYITVNILLSQFCFCRSTESNRWFRFIDFQKKDKEEKEADLHRCIFKHFKLRCCSDNLLFKKWIHSDQICKCVHDQEIWDFDLL